MLKIQKRVIPLKVFYLVTMNELFPIFLKLENLHTLIVGGGKVGLEKLTAIYTNSPKARVTLVAPEIVPEIVDLATEFNYLKLEHREFTPNDLIDKDLAVLATNNRTLNAEIRTLAKKQHLLVNVADTPDLCDFYLSSVVRKGNLKIGISTNGLSPTLAKRLREVFTEALPDNLETAMQQLNQVRELLKGDFESKVEEMNRLTKGLLDDKQL